MWLKYKGPVADEANPIAAVEKMVDSLGPSVTLRPAFALPSPCSLFPTNGGAVMLTQPISSCIIKEEQ